MSDEAVAESGAFDDRARREMRRYRRWAWGWLLGGLAVFIGFVFALMTVYQRAGELERTGVRIPGVVSNVRALGENGSIVVDFEWRGIARSETIHLDAESPRYRVGQLVIVLVDKNDPSHLSITGETSQSPVTVWPMVFALVGSPLMVATGLGLVLRAWRQGRLLRRSSWVLLHGRYVEIRSGRTIRPLLLIDTTEPEPRILTLASTLRWRLRKSGLRGATGFEVAGDLSGYFVVRAPGANAMFSAHPPRTKRAAKRWERAAEKALSSSSSPVPFYAP